MSQRSYRLIKILYSTLLLVANLSANTLTDMVDLSWYKGYPQMVQAVYEAWIQEGKQIPHIVKTAYTNISKGNTKVTLEELLELSGALGPYAGSYKEPKRS